MNRSLTQFKHNLNQNLFKANSFFRENWFKVLLVLVVAFIITRKDLNFQFALNNTSTTIQQPHNGVVTSIAQPSALVTGNRGTAQQNVEKVENTPTDTKKATKKITPKKPKVDDNKAQTFSNLGFALNPTYAKRHNIDPAIVAEKKRILDSYIKRFAPIAVQEMKEYGIPASITLAQGLLESNAGDSRLAKDANNHFGIKCFSKSCGKGHCKNYTDDTHKDFFRVYTNVWESYRAHSLFLQRNRYKHLLKLKKTDYKAWAHGLRKAGYATDKRYAYKLISIIEVLDLQRFDK
ncbi:MAG: glucosaminidase domain-containing protein [Saprospiraceae bacterium]